MLEIQVKNLESARKKACKSVLQELAGSCVRVSSPSSHSPTLRTPNTSRTHPQNVKIPTSRHYLSTFVFDQGFLCLCLSAPEPRCPLLHHQEGRRVTVTFACECVLHSYKREFWTHLSVSNSVPLLHYSTSTHHSVCKKY